MCVGRGPTPKDKHDLSELPDPRMEESFPQGETSARVTVEHCSSNRGQGLGCRPQAPLTSTLGCGLQGQGEHSFASQPLKEGAKPKSGSPPQATTQRPTSTVHQAQQGCSPWMASKPGEVGPGVPTLCLMEKQMETPGWSGLGIRDESSVTLSHILRPSQGPARPRSCCPR